MSGCASLLVILDAFLARWAMGPPGPTIRFSLPMSSAPGQTPELTEKARKGSPVEAYDISLRFEAYCVILT